MNNLYPLGPQTLQIILCEIWLGTHPIKKKTTETIVSQDKQRTTNGILNFLVPNSKNTFSDSKSRTFENVINNHWIYLISTIIKC